VAGIVIWGVVAVYLLGLLLVLLFNHGAKKLRDSNPSDPE
jgi:hypothetical protein